MSILPNLCLWRRSLRLNLGGIDLEKLYRATLPSFELLGPGLYEAHLIALRAHLNRNCWTFACHHKK